MTAPEPGQTAIGAMLRGNLHSDIDGPAGKVRVLGVEYTPEQVEALAAYCDAADALRANPSDEWQDAYDAPHPTLGTVTLTPKGYAERAYDTARTALAAALEGK